MSVFISMLRAVNLGGRKLIPMDALRELYSRLGFTGVRTYIQSGNVVFDSVEDHQSELTRQIEACIEGTFGYHVEVFIRTAQDLLHIVSSNPFVNDRHEDPTRLYVTFLYRSPSEEVWNKVTVPSNTTEEFARGDQAVYLYLPNFYGKAKLSNSYFERKLGVPGTTRNWKTVNALYRLATEM